MLMKAVLSSGDFGWHGSFANVSHGRQGKAKGLGDEVNALIGRVKGAAFKSSLIVSVLNLAC